MEETGILELRVAPKLESVYAILQNSVKILLFSIGWEGVCQLIKSAG